MQQQSLSDITELARQARSAASALSRCSAQERTTALDQIADRLEDNAPAIFDANAKDCENARTMVERGTLSAPLLKRLSLDRAKLDSVISGIRQVSTLEDVLGGTTLARQLDDGLNLYRVTCPIGVVLVIFESRPDALPQILSLLLKTGNAGLLKGGSEAKLTNQALFSCIEEALVDAGISAGAYRLLSGRGEVAELLKMERYIDLVIPRGSNELVRRIQESTRIPVLGHADGICHLYIAEDADSELAMKLTIDGKTNYPAACNSIETLLIDRSRAADLLPGLVSALTGHGVELRLPPEDIAAYSIDGVSAATEEDWHTEYCDLILSIKIVDSIDEAIQHINEYGSGHTDTIVTGNPALFDRFFAEVNSAGVYWNASTRFADGFRYGFGAEVGISTSKLHPRGPVGIDGLTTYKYMLVGNGHVAADYMGDTPRRFKHQDIQCVQPRYSRPTPEASY